MVDVSPLLDPRVTFPHLNLRKHSCSDYASYDGCNRRNLMTLKFYGAEDRCEAKAMSKFRAMEERFDSLESCCRVKFPQNLSDCCATRDDGCSLSGKVKFIPVSVVAYKLSIFRGPPFPISHFTIICVVYVAQKKWQDQICYTKDENLLADWERAFAKATVRECCEHNMHYDVNSCCKNSEGEC